MRVRTSKDKLPLPRRVVEIDLADLGRLVECQRANQRNEHLFKTFEFSGGPEDLEVEVEVTEESKPPNARKVTKVEYFEDDVEEKRWISTAKKRNSIMRKEEPTLVAVS